MNARKTIAIARGVLVALALHDLMVGVAALAPVRPAPAGRRQRRFRVVIPAHNEGHVVRAVLRDLNEASYDHRLVRVVVVADRCRDDTPAQAQAEGAEVAERDVGLPGKGHALQWYLDHEPLIDNEALVVLDADNRVPKQLLAAFADELDRGSLALQAYLDIANPDESMLATASALTYWAGNRLGQHGRQVIGWSPDLGGTGMCLSAEALRLVGGFEGALSEDRELAARLVLGGHRVTWLHHVHVEDEKPTQVAVAVRQRARWRNGITEVQRAHLPDLLKRAIAGDLAALDFAVRLVRPSRTSTSLLCLLALLNQARLPPDERRWTLWLLLCGGELSLPPLLLARDGVPLHYIVRYPLALVFPVLSVAARLQARRTRATWVHTPHVGGGSGGIRGRGAAD